MITKIISLSLLLFLITTTTTAQEWEFVGLDSMVIKHLYVFGDSIYAGTVVRSGANINAGLYFSSDAGDNWIQLDSTLGEAPIVDLKIIPGIKDTFFIVKGGLPSSPGAKVYKTTDGGQNWILFTSLVGKLIQWFGISPFNINEMYCIDKGWIPGGTFNNLYKSIDGGENWEMLGTFPSSSHGNELSFAFDFTDSMNLYVSVDDHWTSLYLFKSTDKGNSWFYVSGPPVLPKEIYTDYAIPNRIYLTSKLYISNNGGLSWLLATSGLNDTSNYISFFQDQLATSLLYILKSDGLFSSTVDTLFWQRIEGSETLPIYFAPNGFYVNDHHMSNIFIEPVRKELYLGTAEGIYKIEIITNVNEDDRTDLDFSLSQNYPNPFNSSTIIEYQTEINSFVSIKVYDILGNEVAELVNERKESGDYSVKFNTVSTTGGLPSGIYIYRLTAGNYEATKKFILLK